MGRRLWRCPVRFDTTGGERAQIITLPWTCVCTRVCVCVCVCVRVFLSPEAHTSAWPRCLLSKWERVVSGGGVDMCVSELTGRSDVCNPLSLGAIMLGNPWPPHDPPAPHTHTRARTHVHARTHARTHTRARLLAYFISKMKKNGSHEMVIYSDFPNVFQTSGTALWHRYVILDLIAEIVSDWEINCFTSQTGILNNGTTWK